VSAAGDIWATTAWPSGWDVRHVAETASTNTDLLDAVASGAVGLRTVLAADHQTAGRGRLDRRWDAPPGANLLVSIAMAPAFSVPSETTHRVGIAALRASRRLVGADADLGLKWPNDLLLDGRKLAGVLAQRSPTREVVVVGLGLNVGWAPDGAASLAQAAGSERTPHPAHVLRRVLDALDELEALDADQLMAVYRRDLHTLGQEVRVELPDGSVLPGRAVDIDEVGRLVVEASGRRHVLDVGDVVHVRPT
jgi:BirA family transcriptional regulator, biotin operon repressor / biotin---[acetyl-CoA-carboxylase] ligase